MLASNSITDNNGSRSFFGANSEIYIEAPTPIGRAIKIAMKTTTNEPTIKGSIPKEL